MDIIVEICIKWNTIIFNRIIKLLIIDSKSNLNLKIEEMSKTKNIL